MKYDVVCFVARESGFLCLQTLLLTKCYNVKAVFTHKKKPLVEDPMRKERSDYGKFLKVCLRNQIPCFSIDSYEPIQTEINLIGQFDFIVSCNWRYKIAEHLLDRARFSCVNLHRGKIPNYKGAEPVKRAVQNGDTKIYLTSHIIEAEIDSGEIILEESIDIKKHDGESFKNLVSRLKIELYPLYQSILLDSLEILKTKKGE